MKQAWAVARKELNSTFGSPMALIFVGVFLLITFYTFFGVGGFFARGIADVRLLFQAMPALLIFLIAALTMRQWSEEQQTGTLEMMLTLPARLTQLVIGKFIGVMVLVAAALALTLTLPLMVASLGNLDWGPVIGGYLAALLMASAYVAIGLFISSQTDNQIVALILTVLVCGAFYLIGTSTVTGLVGNSIAEVFRAVGTGSRFESIERGVIDARDLVYYLSLCGLFLTLNVLSLDSKRWSTGSKLRDYRQNRRLEAILIAVNLILLNVLLFRVDFARIDMTQTGEYSLSGVTRDLLGNIQEPLLIRGYFSEKTHPLLAPLIPRVRDMLKEYEIAAKGKITLQFLDPITDPTLEAEANQTYGIRATPLQVADRGGTSLVNSYFDILLRYGDQTVVLNLLDLIEVNEVGTSLDVRLRNLEYDLTASLQRVMYGFQSLDAVLESLESPATLTLFYTPATLPERLKNAPDIVKTVAESIKSRAGGKFEYQLVDLSDASSGINPQELSSRFGIDPIAVGFLSPDTFYLHMLLQVGVRDQVIYPSGEFSETEVKNALEAALKRLAPGFLQVLGVWTPPAGATDPFGNSQQYQSFQQVLGALRKSYEVRTVTLEDGQVPADINALFILAPQNMTDLERYAVDQYLMRGGSVFVATGAFQIAPDPSGSIGLAPVQSGLIEMLTEYGITIEPTLVLDTQNVPFPIQVSRVVSGMTVAEIQAINYAHFVDVRQDGMNRDNPASRNLPSVTMIWSSPINLNQEKLKDASVVTLLQSSPESWVTTDTNTQPNLQFYPDTGFPPGAERARYPLAVAVTGSFTSYFKGKPSPFAPAPDAPTPAPGTTPTPNPEPVAGFLEKSPASARLVVVSSAEFLNDNLFTLLNRIGEEKTSNNLLFVQNTADWFVEDTALATIRARGTASRLLRPLAEGESSRWEGFNYLFAILALVGLGAVWQIRRRTEKPIELLPLNPADQAADEKPVPQEGREN